MLPAEQQEALSKALMQVKGRAAAIVVGSHKGWGTATHIDNVEHSFLELQWKDAIAEAQLFEGARLGKGMLLLALLTSGQTEKTRGPCPWSQPCACVATPASQPPMVLSD